jgi:glutamate racemase
VTQKKVFENIFFFDSGQGGLTLWESVSRFFPLLNTVYLGDNARYPYGNKGVETIYQFTIEALEFAKSQGASLFVVACGTASSAVVESLIPNSSIPIVGVVDQFATYASGVAAATYIKCSRFNSVAILGTRFTVQNGRLGNLIEKQFPEGKVWQKACPLFVPIVEEGITEGSIAESICDLYLSDVPNSTSVVLLACTHFPRLVQVISKYLANKLRRNIYLETAAGRIQLQAVVNEESNVPIILMDSSSTIVQYLENFLNEEGQNCLIEGKRSFFCTDDSTGFKRVAKNFLPDFEYSFERISLGKKGLDR